MADIRIEFKVVLRNGAVVTSMPTTFSQAELAKMPDTFEAMLKNPENGVFNFETVDGMTWIQVRDIVTISVKEALDYD